MDIKIIEVDADCNKCKNLGNDECKIYGKDCDEAVSKCIADKLKNYEEVESK